VLKSWVSPVISDLAQQAAADAVAQPRGIPAAAPPRQLRAKLGETLQTTLFGAFNFLCQSADSEIEIDRVPWRERAAPGIDAGQFVDQTAAPLDHSLHNFAGSAGETPRPLKPEQSREPMQEAVLLTGQNGRLVAHRAPTDVVKLAGSSETG
jgi:hypothetical protein